MNHVQAGVLASFVLLVALDAQQPGRDVGRDVGCRDWRGCREQALAAADRREHETFHNLAWRAVQLGPPNDPALMFLLVRAQALSGRPHDALVMLDRLAGMGVASDVESDDFVVVRTLPEWPAVAAHIERVRRPDAAPAVVAPAAVGTSTVASGAAVAGAADTTAAATAPGAPSPSMAPAVEAVRFSTGAFTPGGLAYDSVSDRFLVGDRLGRKLIVVTGRSNQATDFVRADSAGFQEIAAIEIDAKRGDLWVGSSAPSGGAGTVHKLQLISGRPLRSFPIAAELEPVAFADLAVTAAGALFVLDSAGAQLLVLRPGAEALERVMRLDARAPASLAAGRDEGIAYVAHGDGVSRVDLRARTATSLTAPASIALDRLERIRWNAGALIAIRLDEDSSRRIIRFDLNPSGRAVTKATTLERSAPILGPTFLTFSGDQLVYLADGAASADGSQPAGSRAAEFVAYRLRLR
jgi:hypothetical protein